MSTAPAAPAGAAAAPDAGTAPPPTKIETVPADIRRRVLGTKAPTPEEIAAKEKAEKEAADKKALDDKAAADKKKSDDETAARAAAGTPPPDKVKKVKAGPPLPEKAAAAPDAKQIDQVVREVLKENERQTAPAAAPVDPEVQREIELATFAAAKNPERYAGMADKVKSFYAWNAEHTAAKAKELGGERSPEFREYLDSDEYKALVVQNRPSYARGDRVKLAEDLIATRARAEARQEMAPELKALERKTAELEHAPVIRAKTNEILKIVITDPAENKDPAMEGFAKDPEKFGHDHPEEARIIASEAAEAVELVTEVYRMDLDLVDFNPRAPTPRQAQIRKFMQERNAELRAQHPSGIEMPGGKILVDADTFLQRGLDKDPRYRVFNADEIAGMLAVTANSVVRDRLQKRREGITKSVYAPRAATPPSAPNGQDANAPQEPPSPGATTRAAPGTAMKPKESKSLGRRYA